MILKEYLQKSGTNAETFSVRSGVPFSSLYAYMSGRRKPSQRAAEKIEKASKGKITVMEMRGKDNRKKK